MMGGGVNIITLFFLFFWGLPVAVAVLILGAIESAIGKYGTVLTSIGSFIPLLLSDVPFSPTLMQQGFWEQTASLWWMLWMATGLLLKNRKPPLDHLVE
jgi:hypothetical protein